MSNRTWRFLDWMIPVATTVALTVPPQWIEALKARSDAWAVVVGVAIVGGRVVYQCWKQRRG